MRALPPIVPANDSSPDRLDGSRQAGLQARHPRRCLSHSSRSERSRRSTGMTTSLQSLVDCGPAICECAGRPRRSPTDIPRIARRCIESSEQFCRHRRGASGRLPGSLASVASLSTKRTVRRHLHRNSSNRCQSRLLARRPELIPLGAPWTAAA